LAIKYEVNRLIFGRVFFDSIPKDGNEENENEDAIALQPRRHEQKLTKFRCAIADGATQASFSRFWANILVNNAMTRNFTPSVKKADHLINDSCEEWQNEINKFDLPWFAEEKATKGAFSSFLWIGINSHRNQEYAYLSAISIGDSELFVIRNEKILHAQPFSHSDEFNSSPSLVSSKREKNRDLNPNFLKVKVIPGDDVILSSDALAKYLLSQFEIGVNPLNALQPVMGIDHDQTLFFKDWIASKRRERVLKNDDSTFVWIHLYVSTLPQNSTN